MSDSMHRVSKYTYLLVTVHAMEASILLKDFYTQNMHCGRNKTGNQEKRGK